MSFKKNRTYRKTKYVIYKETLLNVNEHIWALVGSFVGLGVICFLKFQALSRFDLTLLIGSFGASCVLIYGVIDSPLAQPRNLVGGHLISAIIGVTIFKLVPILWIAAPLAVSLSIIAMQITKTLHPPGGTSITSLEYMYVLSPVLSGVIILLIAALIFNNIPKNRTYPKKGFHLFGKKII